MTNTPVTPSEYKSKLNLIQTELAIKQLKEFFENKLSKELHLIEISAPLFLKNGTGLNDNLNGVERVVSFEAYDLRDNLEIVQSLAKWKRNALKKYNIPVGSGIYTNMNAIRRDEMLDCLHSIYVDQWDWEKVISCEQRNLDNLVTEVQTIYKAIKETEEYLYQKFPLLNPILPNEITFITSQQLEDRYPGVSPKERENKIAKEFGAVFIMQIGGELRSGEKHDGRSPDYDDWALNGDIIFWYPEIQKALEVSSMGIRVNAESLIKQLKQSGNEERSKLEYHQAVLKGLLPFSIGGGIGKSRLCMFLLKKIHIGEVQVSVWNDDIIQECKLANIPLL
ncbi:aspartate--ammonia ligase [Bacillus carboniphilus]|uniref:Aspartate--ammonia ligase n=1 Tax=Bacillus carboniphilus TaxID=86663 RepID=A0ABP3FVG2_9BACI